MKRFLPPLSLKRKIILAIVFVGLLPLILSLLLTYFEERRALREAAGINFRGIAVELARKVETQITRGINEAQQLATLPFIRSAVLESNRSYIGKNPDQIKAFISEWEARWRTRDQQNEFPLFINQFATNYLIQWHAIRKADYLAIMVVDSHGALVLSSFPQVKFFYGRSAWWQAVFRRPGGQLYAGDLFFDPSFGTHVLNVAVPILNNQRNKVIGAISVLLRRDSLFRSISEVAAGVTGHAMLVADNGKPLICPVAPLEEHVLQPEVVHALATREAGWLVADRDSHGARNSIVGFAPLHLGMNLATESFGGRQWRLLVRQDPEETYAPLNHLLMELAVYGCGVFVVLWFTGIMVAGRMVKPIQSLYAGVQRIGLGDLDHHLTVKTGDEIEVLAEAFNRMAGNLQKTFSQLNQKMAEIGRLEEKYRDLIEHSPEMIHQVDPSGRFVHVNQTGLDKLGFSLEDMLKMFLWDLVPNEKKQEIREYVASLSDHVRQTIETVFLNRRGERIDVEIHTTTLMDHETGALVYSRGFVRDITERKVLQREIERYTLGLEQEVSERTKQLSHSEARYKALFDLAADSIVVVDEEGRVEAVNERERDALGHHRSDLLGRPMMDFLLPPYRESVTKLLQTVREGSQVPTQEIQVYDAEQVSRSMEIDLIRVEVGAHPSVMVQLRDIMERKRLEEQLQKYSEELEGKVHTRTHEIERAKHYIESLLENANDVIYTLDHDQQFTYVNGKVEAWGYHKEDLIGRPYLALLSKRYRGRHLRETLDMAKKQMYEIEVVSKTGDIRFALVSISPLYNDEGVYSGVLGIARDITDRKMLEQQVRNAERLASIGKLAAGVAHEINNPLGGILNCLYNIRKGTLTASRAQEYMHLMEDGLYRVQKIVRQLLDFSQQHEPELKSVDVNVIMDRVLALTDYALLAKQVMLTREYAPVLPKVMVDPHMMEQVFMNLVLNAVQATAKGGMITIRTREQAGQCEIDVEDTGCGIVPEVRPHIFDPFFTTKRTGEGTGLGLSVSLGIIERHGGEMKVETQVDKGTTFTVRLPVVPKRTMTKVGL